MATSEPLDPFLRQPSHTSPQIDPPCNPSNTSALEPQRFTPHAAAFTKHRSMSPVATASSVSTSSLVPSPTMTEFHASTHSTTPFMASVLASRHLPLPVPQRRQSTPLMSQKNPSTSSDLPSSIPPLRPSSTSPNAPFRAWPPTRSFSHDVTPTTPATCTAAEQQQKQQLASQLQYLHQLDQMHRQRIRDIQRLHEQQQLFASPQHRLTRRHKPAANRLYHEVGSPSHETQQDQPNKPLLSFQNNQAGNRGLGLNAQPSPTQPNPAVAAAWSEDQQPPRQDHYVRRFQLAQRMLQIQQMLHTQRIQQLQYMHKLNKVQEQQPQQHQQQQSIPELKVSEPSTTVSTTPTTPSSPTSTNTSTVVTLAHSNSNADVTQHENNSPSLTVDARRTSPEISRITLPNLDTIRKQRRQRLKAQARLRQAAAAERARKSTATATAVENKNSGGSGDALSVSKEETASVSHTLIGDSVTSGPLSDKPDDASKAPLFSPTFTPPHLALLTLPSAHLRKKTSCKEDAALRLSDCSISQARLKTKAELAYKKQLVRQQSLQHHMIQDHTNRYRIYQAYCLLQRAREAQAMDELKVIELKQAQTRSWVEALRSQVNLEIPE